MPQFMDQITAVRLYRRREFDASGIPTGGQLTYSRQFWGANMDGFFGTRKDWLTGYGLDNSASVLVIGSGFGFLLEYLIDAGITNVVGIEPGSYFWDAANDDQWRSDVKALTVNDWIGSGTEVASLTALPSVSGQARFTYVIDEDAITMHTDAEIPAFVAACEARLQGNAKGRIFHLVTPNDSGDPSVNWKSMAEWSTLVPDHSFVDVTAPTPAIWRNGVVVG